MRKPIILTCILLVLLVPACILSVPNKETPEPTNIPSETQQGSTTTAPTELAATLISPTDISVPAPSATQISPPTQMPATPMPTETSLPTIVFYMQPGTPIRIANFVKPESGCNWMGVAGQVFDLDGNPISGDVIEVGGTLDGQPVQQIALSGSSPVVGPGGYVIELSNHPVQSDGTIWFQLLNQDGNAKTGRILLTTSSECEENLILINLIEANPIANQVRLPVILKSAP